MPAAWQFDAIGTRWEIVTAVPCAPVTREVVTHLISQFDREWSRFRADSSVVALANGVGSVPAPQDARALRGLYQVLSAATGGAVNPFVGESLESLGYGLSPAAAPSPLGARTSWQAEWQVDDSAMTLAEPALIDVGAAGKGRLVDLVLAVLKTAGHESIVVDASGDIAVHGSPITIGLEHPYHSDQVIGTWEVQNAALCASATNRRVWGDRLHHVLDARTGAPVETVAATWVVAETAMIADGVATALFFDGGAMVASELETQWVRMYTDGRLDGSPHLSADIFAAR